MDPLLASWRHRVLAEFGRLFDEVTLILDDENPMAARLDGAAIDDYGPQAETILRLLPEARSAEDATVVVHEAFVRWYGDLLVGPRETFAPVAGRIYAAWRRHRSSLDEEYSALG